MVFALDFPQTRDWLRQQHANQSPYEQKFNEYNDIQAGGSSIALTHLFLHMHPRVGMDSYVHYIIQAEDYQRRLSRNLENHRKNMYATEHFQRYYEHQRDRYQQAQDITLEPDDVFNDYLNKHYEGIHILSKRLEKLSENIELMKDMYEEDFGHVGPNPLQQQP